MKAFIICTSLFLLLSVLVVSLAFFSGHRIEKLQSYAEKASLDTLSGNEDDARLLFSTIKKEWEELHVSLLLTIHHSTLKPIELAITDAKNAIALENRDRFYEALVRLSHELSSLSDDIMRPAL